MLELSLSNYLWDSNSFIIFSYLPSVKVIQYSQHAKKYMISLTGDKDHLFLVDRYFPIKGNVSSNCKVVAVLVLGA